jgi:CheY-like chemotaxis protein
VSAAGKAIVFASRRSVRVLIVEDEPATALLLENMLTELGFEQVEIAYDPFDARDVAGCLPPDLAILAMNIGEDRIFALAEKLRARNVPVLFSTGQAACDLPSKWSSSPPVPKPLDKRMLNAALCSLGFVPS